MHVKLIWVGKTRNPSIRNLLSDYMERLRHMASCEIFETKDFSRSRGLNGPQLLSAEAAEIGKVIQDLSRIVVLDDKGTQFSSVEFARWFENETVRGTKQVGFIIGGPDGLSPEIVGRASLRLSLGKMTWTHEMCRVLLVEQLYRACSILRNIPYHK